MPKGTSWDKATLNSEKIKPVALVVILPEEISLDTIFVKFHIGNISLHKKICFHYVSVMKIFRKCISSSQNCHNSCTFPERN